MISFTGSTETGRKVMKNASATLKRLTLGLELGQLGFQEFTQIRLMVEAND